MNWLVYLMAGKLLIYLGQEFPLPDFLERNENISKWHKCDLCFGCWIYVPLSYFLQTDLLSLFGLTYTPFVSELITGGAISFLVHVFSIGWKDKFSSDIVIV